jgi:hypothetical protein
MTPQRFRFLKVALALLAVATSAIATVPACADPAPQALVAVVVTIPIPAGLDRAKIVAGMEKTVPKYQALPGLVRKYFTISEDHRFGGIYLWKSREAAVAYYDDAWRARILKTYGAPAEVTYFDVPIAIEGPESAK